MSGSGARNVDLKEEIRTCWSNRAPGFDASPGHRIAEGAGTDAWRHLIAAGLGPIEDRRILDLACSTGEISRVLLGAGAEVIGVDFSEAMLDRARAKLAWRGVLADAETPAGLPDATFDGAITRHLAWTLTNPDAALHRDILARVPYAKGLTRDRLAAGLARAGFVDARAFARPRLPPRPAPHLPRRAAEAARAGALRPLGAPPVTASRPRHESETFATGSH